MIKIKDMLFVDFPSMKEITEKVKDENKSRVFTGGVRINNGMYRTDKQMKTYVEESLARELP